MGAAGSDPGSKAVTAGEACGNWPSAKCRDCSESDREKLKKEEGQKLSSNEGD